MDVEKKALDGPGGLDEEKMVLKNHDGHATVADGGATAAMGDVFTDFGNDSTVKFVNGDLDPEVAVKGKEKEDENEFVGLKKEELMKYATDPYWVKVRIILLVLFALCWFAMLAAAIAIIVIAPKCPPQPNLDWWQKSIIYHVHPQSFLDSDDDGFGDVKGRQSVFFLLDDINLVCICYFHVIQTSAVCPCKCCFLFLIFIVAVCLNRNSRETRLSEGGATCWCCMCWSYEPITKR